MVQPYREYLLISERLNMIVRAGYVRKRNLQLQNLVQGYKKKRLRET